MRHRAQTLPEKKVTTNRNSINSGVEAREVLQAGIFWSDRLELFKNRGEILRAPPMV